MDDEPRTSSSPLGSNPAKFEPRKPRTQRILGYRLLLGLALAVFVADQLTKLWIAQRLPLGTYGEAAGAIRIIKAIGSTKAEADFRNAIVAPAFHEPRQFHRT